MTGPTCTPSHVGLCVSDLERSLRFYCDGLGFTRAESYPIGDGWANSLEVEGEVALTSQFVRKEGLSIELLHYTSPGTIGEPSQHRNQLGLTHLSFWVADVAEATAHLVTCGGTLLESTRATEGMELVFLSDPDGTRVELMQQPDSPA
jgi:catechol 2,3-dioxygenase-like lactoylglutathione lyase family enzyme